MGLELLYRIKISLKKLPKSLCSQKTEEVVEMERRNNASYACKCNDVVKANLKKVYWSI